MSGQCALCAVSISKESEHAGYYVQSVHCLFQSASSQYELMHFALKSEITYPPPPPASPSPQFFSDFDSLSICQKVTPPSPRPPPPPPPSPTIFFQILILGQFVKKNHLTPPPPPPKKKKKKEKLNLDSLSVC